MPDGGVPRQRELRVNPFLQSWKPKKQTLPVELKEMMRLAKKYGLRLEGLAFSRQIMRSMPMWDHACADKAAVRRLAAMPNATKCLMTKHRLRTVGDFADLVENADMAGHNMESEKCECTSCKEIRERTGCENPTACMSRASRFLATLAPRWDPRGVHPEDYERDEEEEPPEEGAEWFDRRITIHGHMGDAFRIFTDEDSPGIQRIDMRPQESEQLVVVATDGSCINNGQRGAIAGAGVYVDDNHHMNASLRLPADMDQSNQTGEMVATLIATMKADET
ncbi:hypothetical protein BD310DRAFT_787191, partial [Dichomitus squalens]